MWWPSNTSAECGSTLEENTYETFVDMCDVVWTVVVIDEENDVASVDVVVVH